MFLPTPISRDVVASIVECGRMAPTGMDAQSVNFYVVTQKALVDEIATSTEAVALTKFPHLAARKAKLGVSNAITYGAPVVILLTYPTGGMCGQIDVGHTAENILIAAEAHGLGAVPTLVPQINAEKIFSLVGADSTKETFGLLIPIGEADPRYRNEGLIPAKTIKSKVVWKE